MTHIPKHVPHAEEFMNKTYFVLAPDVDIFAAIDEMLERGIPEAYILDEDHNLVGILTKLVLRNASATPKRSILGLSGSLTSDMKSETRPPRRPL
jgi:predicted transcriptional regulator